MTVDVSTQKQLVYKCSRLVEFAGLANEFKEITDDKGNITQLIADDLDIQVGKTVRTNKIELGSNLKSDNRIFKVNLIKRNKLRKDNGITIFNYDLIFDKLNQCTTFVLPMFFIEENMKASREAMWFGSHFVNSYVNVDGAPVDEIGSSIYLLYRFSTSKEFMKFDTEMQARGDFMSSTTTDKYHVLYQLRTPDSFKEDYTLFLQGKFSHFSEDYKKVIRVFHHIASDQKVYKVLYKDPKLKAEMERELEVTIPESQDLSEFPDINGTLTFRDHLII